MYLAKFWLTLALAASGPIIVGGGGQSEYSLIFVRNNLATILSDCARLTCELTDAEAKVMTRLQAVAQAAPEVVFASTTELGNRLFALRPPKVWINQDLLWLDSSHSVPYEVSTAGALWVDILAASVGISEPSLQTLRFKLAESLKHKVLRGAIELNPGQTYEFIIWSQTGSDVLVLRDPSLRTLDLSTKLRSALGCTQGAKDVRLFAPAWTANLLSLQLGVRWRCEGRTFSSSALLSFNADFNPESVLIYVDREVSP